MRNTPKNFQETRGLQFFKYERKKTLNKSSMYNTQRRDDPNNSHLKLITEDLENQEQEIFS